MTSDRMTLHDLGWRVFEGHRRYKQRYKFVRVDPYNDMLYFTGIQWILYIRYKSSDE
jgi:hypothetical protein